MKQNEQREIQLQSGYFFSPGYYMGYWKDTIMQNFIPEQVAYHVKLKDHREVWIGAHLAALKTKLSGKQFFVALPESDPPDILIGTFSKIKVPSGRTGHNLDWYPVENTRCDMSAGETLQQQIENKNKPAYRDMVLTVYLQGAEKVPDLHALHKELKDKKEFYPHEVIVMVQLQGEPNGIPANSFGFVQVYPKYDHAIIARNDTKAFFTEPNIMEVTGRGVQQHRVRAETIRLMPPEIREK